MDQPAKRRRVEQGAAETQTAGNGPEVEDSPGGARCAICLDGGGEPAPIQRGCCCRGDGGLAHLSCMAQLGAHKEEQEDDCRGWWACGTCRAPFTGAMQHGLARAWWARVSGHGEEDEARLASASNLANSHRGRLDHAAAAGLQEEVLAVRRRVRGEEHPATLQSANNLAATYLEQGKLAAAAALQETVLAAAKQVFGKEHPNTLAATDNLAVTYAEQGKHAEAGALQVGVLAVSKRVQGAEHPDTLAAANNLAMTLVDQGKHAEAAELLEKLLAALKRVLGRGHPRTLASAGNLAETRRRLAAA